MSEVEAKVREILASLPSLYLATTQGDTPWVAGGFFAETGLFTLGMLLETGGTTLANIKANPHVAMVVSAGDPFAAYLQGSAEADLVDDLAEVEGTKTMLLAKAPQIEPFLSAPIQAIRLRVRYWRATDVTNGWLPGKLLEATNP